MLPTILIIGTALYWLMRESNYLRINLMLTLDDNDLERNYDGADSEYIEAYEAQLSEAVYDYSYQAWLEEYHAPKNNNRILPSRENQLRERYNYQDSRLFEINTGKNRYQPVIDNRVGG
jgi:hypothetical protein